MLALLFSLALPAMDALCSLSDETHEALMSFYQGRLSQQLETATTEDILATWYP